MFGLQRFHLCEYRFADLGCDLSLLIPLAEGKELVILGNLVLQLLLIIHVADLLVPVNAGTMHQHVLRRLCLGLNDLLFCDGHLVI